MITPTVPDNDHEDSKIEITEVKEPTKEAQFTVHETVAFRDFPIKDSSGKNTGDKNPRNTLMASSASHIDPKNKGDRHKNRDENHIHFFDNEEGEHFNSKHPVGTRLAKSKYSTDSTDDKKRPPTTDLLNEVKNFLQYTLNLKK